MTHILTKTAAVSTQTPWMPIDADTPRGVKLQLINRRAGVATYGHTTAKESYFTHWAPLPAWNHPRKETNGQHNNRVQPDDTEVPGNE